MFLITDHPNKWSSNGWKTELFDPQMTRKQGSIKFKGNRRHLRQMTYSQICKFNELNGCYGEYFRDNKPNKAEADEIKKGLGVLETTQEYKSRASIGEVYGVH